MTGVGCAVAIGSVLLAYGGAGASRLAQYADSGVWLGLVLGLGGLLVAVAALLLMAWSALSSRVDRNVPAAQSGAEAGERRASVGGDARCPRCGGPLAPGALFCRHCKEWLC